MTIDHILNYGQYMTAGHERMIIGLFFGCQDNIRRLRIFFGVIHFFRIKSRASRDLANKRYLSGMAPTRYGYH